MNYEFLDLGLIFINLLFCGLLLHKHNKLSEKVQKVQNLTIATIKNPKTSKILLKKTDLDIT